MKTKPTRKDKRGRKSVLRLPDLEVAKSAVLNSLSCPDAQRDYRHAIDEFVDWYCSEPRLSFSKRLSSVTECTWNLPSGLRDNQPSTRGRPPAGIRGVRLRSSYRRLGRGDTARQGRQEDGRQTRQLAEPNRGKHCGRHQTGNAEGQTRSGSVRRPSIPRGLPRHELAELSFSHLQQREGHWAIVDRSGKAGHVRTIPCAGLGVYVG